MQYIVTAMSAARPGAGPALPATPPAAAPPKVPCTDLPPARSTVPRRDGRRISLAVSVLSRGACCHLSGFQSDTGEPRKKRGGADARLGAGWRLCSRRLLAFPRPFTHCKEIRNADLERVLREALCGDKLNCSARAVALSERTGAVPCGAARDLAAEHRVRRPQRRFLWAC